MPMSSIAGIGSRLHQIRTKLGYSQSKVAAALSISDRSFKNYEANKTDLPLGVAVAFCKTFSVDLSWLISGEASLSQAQASHIFEECVSEILSEIAERSLVIPTAKIAKACAYLATQCLEKGTNPNDEVSAVMELII